jgi:hypothetical protein
LSDTSLLDGTTTPQEWLNVVAPDIPEYLRSMHVAESSHDQLGLPEELALWLRTEDHAAIPVVVDIRGPETGQLLTAVVRAIDWLPHGQSLLLDPEASPVTSPVAMYTLRARASRYSWRVVTTHNWVRCSGVAELLHGVSTHLLEGYPVEYAAEYGGHYALVDRLLYTATVER